MPRPWMVTFSRASDMRWFGSFEKAERFARAKVAGSAWERFADIAYIHGPGEEAEVRLDGNGRVWTDMRRV